MQFDKMREPYVKRMEVFNRDGFRCRLCGQQAPNTTITIVEEDGDWITVCTACAAGLKPVSFVVILTDKAKTEPVQKHERRGPSQSEMVLQYIKEHPGADVETIFQALSIPPSSIRVALHRLRKAGLIKY